MGWRGKAHRSAFLECWMLFQRFHLVNYLAQMVVITQWLQWGRLGCGVSRSSLGSQDYVMDSKGIPGTAARSCSPPPHHHPPLPFSSVSNFSPLSGWRQAGPLRAFKRLLKVLVRHGPYPSTATHTIHPSLPTKPSKQSQLLSLRMSASITNSPYAGGQGSPMQENWGKKKKKRRHSLVAAKGRAWSSPPHWPWRAFSRTVMWGGHGQWMMVKIML